MTVEEVFQTYHLTGWKAELGRLSRSHEYFGIGIKRQHVFEGPEPGAMSDAWVYSERGPDGRRLVQKLATQAGGRTRREAGVGWSGHER